MKQIVIILPLVCDIRRSLIIYSPRKSSDFMYVGDNVQEIENIPTFTSMHCWKAHKRGLCSFIGNEWPLALRKIINIVLSSVFSLGGTFWWHMSWAYERLRLNEMNKSENDAFFWKYLLYLSKRTDLDPKQKKVRKILLKTEPSEYSQSRYSGDMNLEIP